MVAAVAVTVSTASLLRPAMSAQEWARDRDAPTVHPEPPVGDPSGVHLVLVPHPDDELSGWTSLVQATELRPVMVLMTHGEATARCDTDVLADQLEEELGELAPDPDPSNGAGACAGARLSALRQALREAARHTPTVGLADGPTRSGLVAGHRVDVTVGANATLVIADLGDGALERSDVEELVRGIAEDPEILPPNLPVGRITASAYFAHEDVVPDRERCSASSLCPEGEHPYPYEHRDHEAVREAARSLAPLAEEGSWLVTHPYDPVASVHLALPADVYDSATALGEGPPARAERLGTYQRVYGWLAFPDVWRRGELPLHEEQVLFPRIQSYELVAP